MFRLHSTLFHSAQHDRKESTQTFVVILTLIIPFSFAVILNRHSPPMRHPERNAVKPKDLIDVSTPLCFAQHDRKGSTQTFVFIFTLFTFFPFAVIPNRHSPPMSHPERNAVKPKDLIDVSTPLNMTIKSNHYVYEYFTIYRNSLHEKTPYDCLGIYPIKSPGAKGIKE